MLTPLSYTAAYVVDIDEMDDDFSPAWDAESPTMSDHLRHMIAAGVINEPGSYVIYRIAEDEMLVKKIN